MVMPPFLTPILAFMQSGGAVLWGIAALLLLLTTLLLERYWFAWFSYPRLVATWRQSWAERRERSSWRAQQIRLMILSQAELALSRRLALIRTLVALCPLLGLLGTVTGMIEVFEAMTGSANGSARLMAEGISRATIPTMAGLVVALPGLYFSARFGRLVEQRRHRLGELLSQQEAL